jgi:hypothetical protein
LLEVDGDCRERDRISDPDRHGRVGIAAGGCSTIAATAPYASSKPVRERSVAG